MSVYSLNYREVTDSLHLQSLNVASATPVSGTSVVIGNGPATVGTPSVQSYLLDVASSGAGLNPNNFNIISQPIASAAVLALSVAPSGHVSIPSQTFANPIVAVAGGAVAAVNNSKTGTVTFAAVPLPAATALVLTVLNDTVSDGGIGNFVVDTTGAAPTLQDIVFTPGVSVAFNIYNGSAVDIPALNWKVSWLSF